MKQVLFDKGTVLVEDVPAPTVGAGRVLVEVAASLISVGTELAGVQSTGESLVRKVLNQPEKAKKAVKMAREQGLSATMKVVQAQVGQTLPSGYSCAGTVLEVGHGITDLVKGDRVACAGAGYANHAEVVSVPRNLVVKLPESLAFRDGCSATVGAIALQGVRRAENHLGETVAVIGLGLIGQLTVQMLKSAGCNVCAIDIDDERVSLAKRFGADYSINAGAVDPVTQVLSITDGHGADSVIITAASESNAIAQQAMEMTRKKGKVVVVGAVGLGLKRSPFYEKEIDFLISSSYGPGRYDSTYEEGGHDYPRAFVRWTENRNMQAYLDLVARGSIDFATMVDAAYDINRAADAYAAFGAEGEKTPLAVVLEYENGASTEKVAHHVQLNSSKKVTGKIGVGLIGAGAFAQGAHLPNLKSQANQFQLMAVSSRTGHVAKGAAKNFGAGYATTDYAEILRDDAIDLVIICTRHDMHAKMSMEALRAGKAVLCEKPMAMNEAELNELLSVIESSKQPYMVGFNRRFSPAAVRIKKALSQVEANRAPLVVNYRVIADAQPNDSWIFGPEGGGRVIGEACHMFDLFNFFTESTVESVEVQRISDATGHTTLLDNFSCILRYANGDVCTLTYTTVGNPGLGKEYIEVHCGGASFAIDNFKTLSSYGVSAAAWKGRSIQKGQAEELAALAECLQGGAEWPITLEDLVSASQTSFRVADLLS